MFRAALLLIGLFPVLALTVGQAHALDLKQVGVLLLHGKGGTGGNLVPLSQALRDEGALVVAPRMSWSSGYRTYEESLAEVHSHVAQLRARGAKRVVLIGQSLGTNVAIAYAAQRGGVAAVVAASPGHHPERMVEVTRESLQRAKAMVGAGRGNETASFLDFNQGRRFNVSTTAAAYVSFFDPEGPAVMSRNASRLGGTPILWVIGTRDRNARAAAGGRGQTVTVAAGHGDAPRAAAGQITAWLKSL